MAMHVRTGVFVRLGLIVVLPATSSVAAAPHAWRHARWAYTPSAVARAQSSAAEPAAPLASEAEATLKTRATAWWAAREKRDHQAMYDLYDPEFRGKNSFASFLQDSALRSRGEVSGYRVQKIDPLPDGTVRLTGEVNSTVAKFGGPYSVTVEDLWKRVDGEWFKVYESYRPPFPGAAPAAPQPPR